MPDLPATLLDELRIVLGDRGLITDPDQMAPHLVDWTGTRQGVAAAVLRPGSTAEVSQVVTLCRAAGVALVPQGGNTGLVGGGVPDASGDQVVLSLARMRAVRAVDPVGDTLTVEAGVVLADAQAAAEGVDRLLPISLGSEGSCTVGGNIATNAGGTGVLRYGMMRDLVLGLEVVLPDGRVWDGLRGLRKDNTGYDLAGLFVGSEGTLGVVTAAVLRLSPATPDRATAWVAVPSVSAAVALLGLVRGRAAELLSAFELVSGRSLEMVVEHLPGAWAPLGAEHPWHVLVELSASSPSARSTDQLEAVLAAAFDDDLVLDAVVADSPARRTRLWALREGISEAQQIEGASLKHDVTLPIGSLADWVAAIGPELEALLPGVQLVTYGHVGDGNLHFNLSAPRGQDQALRDAAADLTDAIFDSVVAAGGSISAEHGLGRSKAATAASYKSEVEVDLMRRIKDALDLAGLMNPGAVLTEARRT